MSDERLNEILQKLTDLSKEMNEAIQTKDMSKIEQVHLKKQELITTLNLLIIAQKDTWSALFLLEAFLGGAAPCPNWYIVAI